MFKYFYVERIHRLYISRQSLFYRYGYFVGKKNYVLGQIITVLKNPILTLTHKTAHCTYGQACNPRTRILSHLANLS